MHNVSDYVYKCVLVKHIGKERNLQICSKIDAYYLRGKYALMICSSRYTLVLRVLSGLANGGPETMHLQGDVIHGTL